MSVKLIKRLLQEMPKRHNYENTPEGYKSLTEAKTEDHKRSGQQLHKRDDRAHGPKRPARKKTAGVGLNEEFARMLDRPELEDFPHSGHQED